MSQSFVKLSLLIPVEEVESFLSDLTNDLPSEYMDMPELRVKNSSTELRKRSLSYLVRHIPPRYTVIDCTKESPHKPKLPYSELEEELYINILVQSGIFQILPEDLEVPKY